MQERRPPQVMTASGKKNDSRDLDSPRRKKQLFLTATGQQTNPYQRVLQLHQQLDNVIESMDDKIKQVVSRHEAQFLLAYRNHMKKIKKQLEEIKNSSANAESLNTSAERITSLEKQVVLFRQQALKLYDDLEGKKRQCEQYRMKLDEANSQNRYLETQIKKLMKRTKFLQASFERANISFQDEIRTTIDKFRVFEAPRLDNTKIEKPKVEPPKTSTDRRSNIRKIRTAETNRLSLTATHQINQKLKEMAGQQSILENLNQALAETSERKRQLQVMSTKYAKAIKASQLYAAKTTELEQFFLKCVQIVRKDIIRRTGSYKNTLEGPIDFDSFKKVDMQAVLQLFFKNQQVQKTIYDATFTRGVTSTATVYGGTGWRPSPGLRPTTQGRMRPVSHSNKQRI